MNAPIRPKERDAVLQSLRAGVVPRIGQHLIQVGRAQEISTLAGDIDRLAEGGSSFRLVTGDYGSGKTFYLNMVGAIALEKRLVVARADLSPDRRLHATGGQAKALFVELMTNVATRAKPEGGALAGIVEKFLGAVTADAKARSAPPEVVLREKLDQLSEMVHGYDFANVILAYCRAHEETNEQRKTDAVRWLRGEFATKTEARHALGVRSTIDDASVFDQLKLMARFVRLAGYGGLLVTLDELVNLYNLSSAQARNANYEQLLRILNDSLQGTAVGLGFVMGGTPEFLLNTRRGLYSYPALQGRLAQNAFATGHLVDFTGPVIRLASLTPEDLYVLLQRIRHVHASGNPQDYALPDEALAAFIDHCSKRVGDSYFRTPRTTITAFTQLLAVLDQNPGSNWHQLLGRVDVAKDDGARAAEPGSHDEALAEFKL